MLIQALRLRHIFSLLFGFGVIFSILFAPEYCMYAAKDSLNLCLTVVFPSLFPFMVCAKFLISTGSAEKIAPLFAPVMKLFRLPPQAAIAFFLGILSGYPVGAACVSDLVSQGKISKEQGSHMLAFCNNSGPLFIIGSVGIGMLCAPFYGYLLYFIHLFCAFLTGILLRFKAPDYLYPPKTTPEPSYLSPGSAFVSAITGSMTNLLYITGYIVFFSVLIQLLFLLPFPAGLQNNPGMNTNIFTSFAGGFLEMTNGINNLALIPMDSRLKLSLISALLGFSGICVYFQAKDIVSKKGLSMGSYLGGKLMMAALSFVITYSLLGTNPPALPVFANFSVPLPHSLPFTFYFGCSSALGASLLALPKLLSFHWKRS